MNKEFKKVLAEKTAAELRREIKWLRGHIKARKEALAVKLIIARQ